MNINFVTTADKTINDSVKPQTACGNRVASGRTQEHGEAAIVSLDSSMGELQAQLQNLPDVRSDRVQVLRESIQQGTYSIEPSQVANAMFTNLFGGK